MNHPFLAGRLFAFLAVLSVLVACDQQDTTIAPPLPGPDTTTTPVGTNDVLERAIALDPVPLWSPVRPIAPAETPWGAAWFALDLDSGWTYEVSLKDSTASGASMSLYDEDSSLLRTASLALDTSTPRCLQARFESSRSQRVYVLVQGLARAHLEIRVEILPGQDPGPDAYESLESSSEFRGGPILLADSHWINLTLHRTTGGDMESGDPFVLVVDSGKLYTLHLLSRGNSPLISFLPWGMRPIDTAWTRSKSKNTQVSQLTFAAYRSGRIHLLASPGGPDFKPVHYRLAATARAGIPAGIYPDAHEPDDDTSSPSFLLAGSAAQKRTLHRDGARSDTDHVLLLNPFEGAQVLEIQDSLQAVQVDAFDAEGTPLAHSETLSGSVRCLRFPATAKAPVRIRLVDRLAVGVDYRLSLRSP